ncbi:MAG: hypothetical protein Q8S73_12060 [Deltaproteobacteria bacterium]|nr:hypothetical protein [Myxococcales bacterium]MDP3214833.1 hypothetical protein [Deltaproteobacteria bacterium]
MASPRAATCPSCGLWWVLLRGDERLRSADGSAWGETTLRLPLRAPVQLSSILIPLVLATYGYGAAAFVWTFRASATDLARGALMLVGSLVGILLATSCSAFLLQQLLHFVVPARLEGDAAALRVRVWNTRDGLAAGFRRTDVLVPRDQVVGVALSARQCGDSEILLLHRSGLAFSTGWSGPRADAVRLSGPIVRWVADPGASQPAGLPG